MINEEHISPARETKKKMPARKKVFFIFFVLTLALVAVVAFAYSRYLYPTGEIMPGLYAIKTGGNGNYLVNFFIMEIGEKYIVIDAGSNASQTEDAMQRLGIPLNDIEAVFITHSDSDHIAALGLFNNATIYTGPAEFPDISHKIMSDGEIIEIYGISIKCIYTPGHTSGCVSFLIDRKYLFVGDLLTKPRYSEELQKLNIKNVLEIDTAEYVFTGHFGLFKNVELFRWWRL